jgi:osmoprotectant transport system permease protein
LKWSRLFLILVLSGCAGVSHATAAAAEVSIGSKVFTESVILGEMAAQLARSTGARVVYRRGLGGTQVLWNALLAGAIDVYPEYTGTIVQEILGAGAPLDRVGIAKSLAARGILMTRPLGFNNTYAIGMKEDVAERLHVRTISDLRSHPELSFGFSNEFMDRADGWPGLRRRYRLPQTEVRGLDHDLAYRGLASGAIDATDLYSTDAEIPYYGWRVLKDDLSYFPDYQAVLLYRSEMEKRAPRVVEVLKRLEGLISAQAMAKMNARVKIDKVSESRVAADFLKDKLGLQGEVHEADLADRLTSYTLQHLGLVAVSLGAATLFSIPLGIFAARRPRIGQWILSTVGIIQTIPSLALLVFMIPLLGIGAPPAIVALFLYSLLPIVRNTYTGLHDIPIDIRESAAALGLPPGARLRLVEIPMAARAILAGIKTSAVINVGTATLGALIGAGGYGQPILTGIRLDDLSLIMEGAVPAAVLALLVQGSFDLLERMLVPKGLRLKPLA